MSGESEYADEANLDEEPDKETGEGKEDDATKVRKAATFSSAFMGGRREEDDTVSIGGRSDDDDTAKVRKAATIGACTGSEAAEYIALVQMAEGTSYGIVPFMNKQQLAVVSALVGAGGNLGAVIAGFCFYKPIDDELLPFKIHAIYVMFWTLLSPVYYWPKLGGMFVGPKEVDSADPKSVESSLAEKNQPPIVDSVTV